MERARIRVLHVEDDPIDAASVRRCLRARAEAPSRFELAHAPTLQAGLDRLGKAESDVVLLDLHLPDSSGLDTLRRFRDSEPEIPIVVFTAAEEEALALAALQAGAQDCLVKGEFQGSFDLQRAILHAIERQKIARQNQQLQERLLRTQKLASLGVLSAGVAMAFNRLLGEILEEADGGIAALRGDTHDRLHGHLLAIRRTACRAGEIAGRLRDYAAARPLLPHPIDLSEFALAHSDLLESLVGGDVEVDWHLATNLPPVRAGRLELHQILLSLLTNAVEAIGTRGRIAISSGTLLATRELLDSAQGSPEPPEGLYAYLRVEDDGHGMDAETCARIFDPFFTTRYAGRGLGLAALLGVLRELGAVVRVESRPGEGSTFTVLLPVSQD
jgi:signal transduction histidine kinase